MAFLRGEWLTDFDSMSILQKATKAILDRLIICSSPRSLCELRADEQDVSWLCGWAHTLTVDFIDQCFGLSKYVQIMSGFPATRQQALGLLFLFYTSEQARRFASEHTLWPWITRIFSEEVKRRLFVGNQPGEDLGEAFEEACRRFLLRNVLNQNDVQRYYRTVFLQFGLSKTSLFSDLPQLLTGHTPLVTIDDLLSGEMKSTSFQELWRTLKDYRQRAIARKEAQQRLQQSSWIMASWIDDVLDVALKQPELQDVKDADIQRDDNVSLGEELPFLSLPRLQWDGASDPSFSLEIINLGDITQGAPRYKIWSGSHELVTILRQANGSYNSLKNPLVLPMSASQQEFVLKDVEGNVCATQFVEFWPDAEDIVVFDIQSGARISDPWNESLSTTREYAIFVAEDLKISPLPAHWRRFASLHRYLFLLNAGWADSTIITLEGQDFWSPRRKTRSQTSVTLSELTQTLTQQPLCAHLGEAIRLSLPPLTSVAIQTIRVNGEPKSLVAEQGGVLTEPFAVTADMASSGLQVAIIACHTSNPSQRLLHRQTFRPRVVGVAHFANGTWQQYAQEQDLDSTDAQHKHFRIFADAASGAGNVALTLVEGDLVHHPIRQRHTTNLGQLTGYGAPLYAFQSPFDPEPLLTIASAVVNHGIICTAQGGENGTWSIRLRRPLEWSSKHRIILWPSTDNPFKLDPEQVTQLEPLLLSVTPPAGGTLHTTAIAITYEGAWLGSWWPLVPGSWHLSHRSLHARRLARWLRWFHLPLLHPLFRAEVEQFIKANPFDVIQAWVMGRSLPDGLTLDDDPGWTAAVRDLLPLDLQLSALECRKILKPDSRQLLDLPLQLESLMTKAPLLLATIIQRKLHDPLDHPMKHDILGALPQCINDLQQQVDEWQNPGIGAVLADRARKIWQEEVIPNILARLYSEPVSSTTGQSDWQRQLKVFLAFPWYRKDLALHLLRYLCQ